MQRTMTGLILAATLALLVPTAALASAQGGGPDFGETGGHGGRDLATNRICCDAASCEYQIFDSGGHTIRQGMMDAGECVTLGANFDGFVICACE